MSSRYGLTEDEAVAQAMVAARVFGPQLPTADDVFAAWLVALRFPGGLGSLESVQAYDGYESARRVYRWRRFHV